MRSFDRASHWRRTGAEFGVEMGFLREVRSYYHLVKAVRLETNKVYGAIASLLEQ